MTSATEAGIGSIPDPKGPARPTAGIPAGGAPPAARPMPRAYRWLGPDAAMRHAVAAFLTSCRLEDRSRDEWRATGGEDCDEHPASAEGFIEVLTDVFKTRLYLAAAAIGELSAERSVAAYEHLQQYYEPMWISQIPPIREELRDIHCRGSHNGTGR